MTEITLKNFEEKFGEIKVHLENAKLIAIDAEFSALAVSKELEYRYLYIILYNTSNAIRLPGRNYIFEKLFSPLLLN